MSVTASSTARRSEAQVDRDLVERARHGDRDAFATLVHQVSDALYAIGYRMLRDTSLTEDALQNALVTAWRQLPHLRDPGRFEAWMYRILVNSCYVEVRRTRRWSVNVRSIPDYDEPATPDASHAAADRDELERAFRKLPIEQRSVFVLHHYVGLPLVEVAETLGIPAGTARSRLHYATRTLRSAVEAERGLPVEEGRTA
jgi:RNA polymerase sigma-70 factor (ECF subfamily)